MIRLERLACAAGRFRLGEIDLAIEPGEYFALLGPTGCGKTMLLECICGLRKIDRGRIVAGGRDITGAGPESRGLGYVPQDYVLFPFLTVAENILFPLRVQRKLDADARAHFNALVDILRISPLLPRKPLNLSGGERQRCALARALVTRPNLLLLDEPYAAVDTGLRKKLWAEMKNMHTRFPVTVLHVTHDFDEALSLSRRAAVMVNGRLEQVWAMGEIIEAPATRAVAEFIGMANIFAGQVEDLDQGGGSMGICWNGWRLRAPLRSGLAAGDRVEFYIRPDRIKLVVGAPGSAAAPASAISAQFCSAMAQRNGRTAFFKVPPRDGAAGTTAEDLEASFLNGTEFAPQAGASVTLAVPQKAVGTFAGEGRKAIARNDGVLK